MTQKHENTKLNELFAQEKISLSQAVEIGLKNNYSIQVANNQKDISIKNKEAAVSVMLPKLDATASYNKSTVDTRQVFVTGVTQERNKANTVQQNAGL